MFGDLTMAEAGFLFLTSTDVLLYLLSWTGKKEKGFHSDGVLE